MAIEMTIDLWLLTWAAVLCLAQVVIAASGSSLEWGLPKAAGNREDVGKPSRAGANPAFPILAPGAVLLLGLGLLGLAMIRRGA